MKRELYLKTTHTHTHTHTHTRIQEAAELPQLYCHEGDAAGRRMRELLCTLEVPYCRRTTAQGTRTTRPYQRAKEEPPGCEVVEEEIVPALAAAATPRDAPSTRYSIYLLY